ncbi:FAD-binding oxidoreductase [Corynebacterium heidelbergense]|uniref:FAD-binding oxidoreductase n=1 Tax=Corynebacterium heidelbergense TaxID=2055947 RepID=A0A364VBN2_9CORY|nr:FAD-binding oxidoreductase [Corynebacterium heidelbergense]RAV34062.1 FAD-binding oxidoreductase [Corynebacterium heidelbergense]
MEFNLWGTPDEAKDLSASVKKMLHKMLGVTEPSPRRELSEVRLSPIQLSDADLAELQGIVGAEYVSTQQEQRAPRARGKSYLDLVDWRLDQVIAAPDAVVAPGSEEEVLAVLRWCSQQSVAVVPFGGGTSVVGGLSPLAGDHRAVLSVDLARFDQCEDVDEESGLATLGAGLSGPHAEMLLAQHGLQIGHFPQSFPYASIGGFAATRSSGQNSAGYGRFDEMVRELTVVTPKGILHPGQASPATAAGPQLKQLFLGSEGLFGIITKVRLRVHPIPETKLYEAFSFATFADGVRALRTVEQTGAGPTVLRLSDEIESSVNLTSTDKIGEQDESAHTGCLAITLFEGTTQHAQSRHQETRALMQRLGGESLGEGPARKWEEGRFGAPVLRDSLMDAGALCETLETATDWSNVPRLKKAVGEALAKALVHDGTPALIMCHVSHVYAEGCSLYFTIVGAAGPQPQARWRAAKQAATQAIADNGGTVTHHHAVGTDHLPWMDAEIGALGIEILRAVKREVDPEGILNPGKTFDLSAQSRVGAGNGPAVSPSGSAASTVSSAIDEGGEGQ